MDDEKNETPKPEAKSGPDVNTMPLADDAVWRRIDAGLPRGWRDRD